MGDLLCIYNDALNCPEKDAIDYQTVYAALCVCDIMGRVLSVLQERERVCVCHTVRVPL